MPQTFTVTTPLFGPNSRKDAADHTKKLEAAVREGFLPLKSASRGDKCKTCGSRLSAAGCKVCAAKSAAKPLAAVRPSVTLATKPPVAESAAQAAERKEDALYRYFSNAHPTVRLTLLNDPEAKGAILRASKRRHK